MGEVSFTTIGRKQSRVRGAGCGGSASLAKQNDFKKKKKKKKKKNAIRGRCEIALTLQR